MLPIQPLEGRRAAVPTSATTASSWWSTARSASPARRTSPSPATTSPRTTPPGREWVELMARLRGPVVATLEAVFAQDWFTETGEIERRRRRTGPGAGAGAGGPARRHLPAGPQRPRLRRREQPAPVHHADLLGAAPDLVDQPLLRARTSRCCTPSRPRPSAASTWSCSSARSPTSSWSATPRRRTTGHCSTPGCGSTSTPRRGSCTASTSRSTTTSRSSGRATWTCGRSRSTTRSA